MGLRIMKRIFLAIVALMLAVGAHAQTRVGFTAGYVASTAGLEVDRLETDTELYSGFMAGLTLRQPLVLGFALQPAFVLTSKGVEYGGTKARISYLEIPVQLQWGLDLVVFRPYVFAEPFIGYAVSGKMAGYSNFRADQIENRFEYGMSLGGGMDIMRSLQLSLRYFWNFESVGEMKASSLDMDKLNGIVLSMSIFF